MCYNDFNGRSEKPCTVKIKTCGGGLDSEITADGSYSEYDGGVRVNYLTDGDSTEFYFEEGRAEYLRSGLQLIRMPFEEGAKTLCEIGYGNMKGSFEVLTRKIEILSDGRGHVVRLSYESGQEGERTELLFTVLYK